MMRKEENNAKTISRKTLAIALSMVLVLGAAVGGTIAWLISSTEAVTNVFTPSNIKVTLTEETNKDDNEYKMIPGWVNDKDPKVTLKANSEPCYLFVKVEKNDVYALSDDGTKGTDKLYAFDKFIAYSVLTDKTENGTDYAWTKLGEAYPGVYYMKIEDTATADRVYSILGKGTYTDPMGTEVTTDDVTITWNKDQVATKPSVTEEMMEALKVVTVQGKEINNYPTLSFTAYASQLYKTNKPDKATDQSEEDYTNAVAAAQFTPAEAWANIK